MEARSKSAGAFSHLSRMGVWENAPQASGIGRISHISPCLGRCSALLLGGIAVGVLTRLASRCRRKHPRTWLAMRPARGWCARTAARVSRGRGRAAKQDALAPADTSPRFYQKLRVWATSGGGDHYIHMGHVRSDLIDQKLSYPIFCLHMSKKTHFSWTITHIFW